MARKLRQISDSIHKTVYVSELESDMMSTAYFYRLHDVYQSSTVYLAFPCNRTKRYEHSYGTMEIAGKMFFSAITNANESVLDSFFANAEKKFQKIVKSVLSNKEATCFSNIKTRFGDFFDPVTNSEIDTYAERIIADSYNNYNSISDMALDHYIPPFANNIGKKRFLYQCALEAIRVVALFHDVGHPPYSHIIEDVLNRLYDICKTYIEEPDKRENEYNEIRVSQLYDSLKPFKKENNHIKSLLSDSKETSSELHENVGLKMLCQAIDVSLNEIFDKIKLINNKKKKATIAIYYISVAEFCVSLLLEADDFFTSLHRVIDGCLDADRMDYVIRDSVNSGVNWGKISYKRLLESCQLIKPDKNKEIYYIAYPEKMGGDIDDLLITRYKIFARINYHHKSYKTGMILKNLVFELSMDYLKKYDEDKSLCLEISELWNCLYSTATSKDLFIIQWNDSTLISHLYKTLVEVKKNDAESYGVSEDKYDEILHMLEEFLLNKRHYYPIIKRQSDFIPILESVFESFDKELKEITAHEKEKLKKDENDPDATEAMFRIKCIEDIKATGDLDLFEKIFGVTSVRFAFDKILSKLKQNGKILSYIIDENQKREKTGLSEDDESKHIYLYSSITDKARKYNTSVLHQQLSLLQNYCLQYIVYVDIEGDGEKTISEIHKELEQFLCEELGKSLKKLFPYINKDYT